MGRKNNNRPTKSQEYRDKLAKELKSRRVDGETEQRLAQTFLSKEKMTDDYIDNVLLDTKKDKNSILKEISKLIENGEIECILRNLQKFQGLAKEIAMKLIRFGRTDEVIDNIQKFPKETHKEIALELIERRIMRKSTHHLGEVAGITSHIMRESFEYLRNFYGLDKEVAIELIRHGKAENIIRGVIKQIDKEIALKLINEGFAKYFTRILRNRCIGLDKEVGMELQKKGFAKYTLNSEFVGLQIDKDLILKAITEKSEYNEEYSLCHIAYEELEKDIVNLIENKDNIKGLVLDKEIALTIIENIGEGADIVLNNLDKFKGLMIDQIFALKCLEGTKNSRSQEKVFDKLNKFEGIKLDDNIAYILINGGHLNIKILLKNIEKFQLSDKNKIAVELLKEEIHRDTERLNTSKETIERLLNKIPGLVRDKELAIQLIGVSQKQGNTPRYSIGRWVLYNLNKFQGITLDKDFAMMLCENRYGRFIYERPERFKGLDKEVAFKIIETEKESGIHRIIKNGVEKYAGLKADEELALEIIKIHPIYLAKKLGAFKGLSKETKSKLIKSGYTKEVEENMSAFQ